MERSQEDKEERNNKMKKDDVKTNGDGEMFPYESLPSTLFLILHLEFRMEEGGTTEVTDELGGSIS